MLTANSIANIAKTSSVLIRLAWTPSSSKSYSSIPRPQEDDITGSHGCLLFQLRCKILILRKGQYLIQLKCIDWIQYCFNPSLMRAHGMAWNRPDEAGS